LVAPKFFDFTTLTLKLLFLSASAFVLLTLTVVGVVGLIANQTTR
jgi:hypothetical protein